MRRVLALALLACALAGGAAAQGGGRGGTPGVFDFYVLALSWSPTYCAGQGERRDDVQCAPGRGLGFVVHGLWPQYARGYPENCSAVTRSPTRQAMDVAGRQSVKQTAHETALSGPRRQGQGFEPQVLEHARLAQGGEEEVMDRADGRGAEGGRGVGE